MNLRQKTWNCRWLSDKQRIEWYPPFWLMRINVTHLSPCWREISIRLPHSWIATNNGGSLFGGFQASLADPIAAMACVKLFPDYSVWTRSLKIDFLDEGVTDLELRFTMPPALEDQIKQDLLIKGRSNPKFEYGYYLNNNRLCTSVTAVIAIRAKGYKKKTSRQ